MRWWVPGLLAVLVFSGCAGSSEEDGAPTSSSASHASTGATNASVEPPAETTDTLYLLKAPGVTLVEPTGSDTEQTPYSFGGGFGGAPPRWEYRSLADAAPTGAEAVIHIRVVEPLFVPPAQSGQNPCAWSLTVFVESEAAFPVMCSGPTGPTVTAGDYELRFSTGSANITSATAGKTWAFQFGRTAFSPTPNEAVQILTSSEEFPSFVSIDGLAEPKPAQERTSGRVGI